MLLVCYEKCGTCRKARKWLGEHGIAYEARDIKLQPPTLEELRLWQRISALPVRKMFNTSGQAYRLMNLKEKLKEMGEEEMLALLASDGMLVKRPILVDEETALFGFDEEKYEALA